MLVKLMDNKGTEYWVNPVHVKALRRKGNATEVYLAINPSWGTHSFKVRQDPDEIAALLNSAMPEVILGYPVDESNATNAAAIAALSG